MKEPQEILEVLRSNLELYHELLGIAQSESEALRVGFSQPLTGGAQARKALFSRLAVSQEQLARCREAWQAMEPARRARHPGIDALVRESQDFLMKIIVLDRENEQALLRQGLVPPRQLPSVHRQRPHFVADLYRRQGGC